MAYAHLRTCYITFAMDTTILYHNMGVHAYSVKMLQDFAIRTTHKSDTTQRKHTPLYLWYTHKSTKTTSRRS